MATTDSTTPTENPVPAVSTPTEPSPPAALPVTGGSGPSMGMPSMGGEQPQPFHSASLYVGDLNSDVNEGLLFEIFNAVGPVSSIRVCRDAVTRRSLGYAYVNFHQIADAERALDTMNYTDIKAKPCRIMWSQRDPSLRRSGVGNIFVKNLQESIDNKQLYDTFSLFGNILSCKVVHNKETGTSKGYGYIHYETAEAAHAAIDKLDGMLIDGQEVQVGEFMRRNERPGQSDWTNCYVKNIPFNWDDAKLFEEFSKFGEVASAAISMGIPRRKAKAKKVLPKADESESEKKDGEEPVTEEGEADANETVEEPASEEEEVKEEVDESAKDGDSEKKVSSLGFGFVNFHEHESALAAVETLNGTEVDALVDGDTVKQELFVGRAQKKSERERELRAKFEAQKMDRISKFQGVNLYVKNLDDSVTDDMLRDEFSAMGTITSARVMKDIKADRSKGFGFVCYSTPEEATRAVNEMNGKLMANKPIFVALAQRREVRRAQLEAQHAQRGGAPGQQMMRGGPMNAFPPGSMPMYIQRPAGSGSMQPSYPMMPQMMGGPGRGGVGGRGAYPMMQQQPRGNYPMQGYGNAPQGGRGRGMGRGRGSDGRGHQQPMGGRGGRLPAQGRGGQPSIKFNQQARNQGQAAIPTAAAPIPQQDGAPQQTDAGAPPVAHEPLTAAALASAPPDVQKNMIGERLYPLIHNSQPDLAGKITGMLLEMDNSELLHLLESPDALNHKITEALQVLEAHNQNSTAD